MVYIKEIIMTGFKSYGNRTVHMPLAPGFTVIVGPNGSGKSNAIDAISFCLGSLSSKSMRMERLTDLLYSGVGKDKPAEKGIVEIVFDNSDFAIPIKEKKISVVRELKQNGQGVYRLNGKRTTRGDILDKLRISGIDCVDGYNIIQQGQVAEIVGMSPVERRELLENIAGVAPFDAKKDAALAELDEAQKKMGELSLLISEVSQRLEVVRKEKETAEKWLELDNEAKRLKSLLVSFKMYKAKNEVRKHNEDIDRILEQIKELEANKNQEIEEKIQGTLDMIKEVESVISSISLELESKKKELNEIKVEDAKVQQQIDFNTKTISDKEAAILRMSQQVANNQKKKESEQQTLEAAEEETKNLTHGINKLEGEKNELENLIREKEAEYEDIKIQYDDVALRLRRSQDTLTKATIQVDMGRSMVDGLERNVQAKTKQILDLKNRINQETTKIMQLQQNIDQGTSMLEEAKMKLNVSESKVQDYDDKIEGEETTIKEVHESSLVLATKLETIKSFMSRKEGEENPAVASIIEMAAKNEIRGVLGELKVVLGGNVPAVIAHLADAVVTVDTESALDCLKALKERALGTAEFIPLDQLGVNSNQTDKLPKKIEEKSEVAVNLDEAASTWKKRKDRVIVTQEGDIFMPNGVITGGFHQQAAQHSVQTLEEEKKSKEEELEALRAALGELKDKKKRVTSLRSMIADSIKKVEEGIRNSIISLQHSRENLKQYKDLLVRAEEEKTPLANQLQERMAAVENAEREIAEKGHQIEVLRMEEEKVKTALEKADVRPLNDELRKKERKINKEEKQLSKIQAQLEITKNNIFSLETQSSEISEQIEQEKLKISSASGSLEAYKNQLEDLSNKRTEIKEERDELLEKIEGEEKRASELRFQLRGLQRETEKINNQINSLKEQMNEIKLKRERADAEVTSAINEANESEVGILPEEEVDLENTVPSKLSSDINKALETKKQLEPVNMRSIEEFEIINTRHKNLCDRRDVIQEERQVIVDFISQIETEKRNVFTKLYNSVNKYFNQIFGELSEEGKAKMILENPEDPFEGGVMIEAYPAGKQVKSLESMSGGEKALTALAFIFAIQQVESQPFYVLDEIDAALDPMNVDRVGRLIHRLSRRTDDGSSVKGGAQFLVISHRDILMAKSDRIYGVTNVKGLSDMFPVEMTDKGFQRKN
ncbi:MAG: chromosome segregation protein SMC [Candidatus Odinarchaeota archaeon]